MGEVKLNIVPGKTTACSLSVRALRVSVDKPTAKPVSPRTAACSGERRVTRRVEVLPLVGEHHNLRSLMCVFCIKQITITSIHFTIYINKYCDKVHFVVFAVRKVA